MGTTYNYGSRDAKLATLAAAKTVTADETGTTFILDAAAGYTVTLPALAPGLNFKFIVGALFAGSDWTIASSEGDNINGILLVNGASVAAVGEDNVIFELGAEAIGDYVEFICDFGNTQWIVNGVGAAVASMTTTDPA